MSKKNIIGLSTLLLVLLLGLFTTSYASTSPSDILNLYYACLVHNGYTDLEAKNFCDAVDFTAVKNNNLQDVDATPYLENENYDYVAFYYDGGGTSKQLIILFMSSTQYVETSDTSQQSTYNMSKCNISGRLVISVSKSNSSKYFTLVGAEKYQGSFQGCYSENKSIVYYNNHNRIIWEAPIHRSKLVLSKWSIY